MAETYQHRVARGKCGACGTNPPRPDKKNCQTCHDKARDTTTKTRNARREAGLCYLCGLNPPFGDSPLCVSCFERQTQKNKARHAALKSEVFAAYGGFQCRCDCGCRISAPQVLTLDHINNNGNEHRREIGQSKSLGSVFYKWLQKNGYPPGFQVLCFNCNVGRHINGGRCPLIA